MTAPLIRAVGHQLRRRILRALHSSGGTHSPIQLTKILDEEVSLVAYHMRVLLKLGAVKKTGSRQVRGARERFYASRVSDHKQMLAILADTEGEDDGVLR